MGVETEIKTFLDALGTLGPIIIGELRPDPDIVCFISKYGGRSPERRFGVSGIGYDRPSINLIFRGAPNDYNGPMARASIAYQALAEIKPGVLGSTEYLDIDPQQSPFTLGKDANLRYEIACNFWIRKEPS